MSRDVPSVKYRVAVRLMRHAAKVLPPNREHWADAMSAELAHITDDEAAIKWTLGCVLASYSERVRDMTTMRPGLSRWVLCVEMLCFFGMPAFAFFDELTPPYYAPWRQTAFILSVALLGPVGFAVTLRTVVFNRPTLPVPAAWALGMLAAWAPFAFFWLARNGAIDLDWWRGYILVALLPALAAAHLIYLSVRSKAGGETMV